MITSERDWSAWFAARTVEADHGFATACWVWQRARDVRGYGRVNVLHQGLLYVYAHRLAHVAFTGPIPPGFEIDHLCLNKLCCNPAHLEAVTKQENVRRAIPQMLAATGREHPDLCRMGHLLAGANLRSVQGRRSCRECYVSYNRTYQARRRADRVAQPPHATRHPVECLRATVVSEGRGL